MLRKVPQMVPFNCPVTKPVGRQKRKFDKAEESDIRRRVKLYQAQIAPMVSAAANKEIAELNLELSRFLSLTTDAMILSPSNGRNIFDFMVSRFGVTQRGLGLNPFGGDSRAGTVRRNILDFQQKAEALVNEAGRINSVSALNAFMDDFTALAQSKSLSRFEVDELRLETIQVGQIPRHQAALGGSPILKAFQSQRYNEFVNRMNLAGFTQPEIDSLINKAVDVSAISNKTRLVSKAIGVDIEQIGDIGYISQIFTSDASMRLKDLMPEQLAATTVDPNFSMMNVFAISRSTNHYVPQDLTVASQFLQIPEAEIADMLTRPLEWRAYLQDNVSVEQLDAFVDSGVASKLPMSSREVFEYYAGQFELPYKELNEMFVTDPRQIHDRYTSALQQSAGVAAIIRRIADDEARKVGWAITEAEFQREPVKFANFVSLENKVPEWSQRVGLSESDRAALRGTYVHPVVADQVSAIMEISTSPLLMAIVGGFMQKLGSFQVKGIVAANAPVYLANNALGGILQASAAGANIGKMGYGFDDMRRVMSQGYDALDNVTPLYEIGGIPQTRQEVFKRFMYSHGNNYAPATARVEAVRQYSEKTNPIEWLMNNAGSAKVAAHHVYTYAFPNANSVSNKQFNWTERASRFGRAVGSKFNHGLDAAAGHVFWMGSFVDLSIKWATYESLLKRVSSDGFESISNVAGKIFSGQRVKEFDNYEALDYHMRQYFSDSSDIGTVTAQVSRFVKPFQGWFMSNLPMQLRDVVRRPHAYLAWYRLNQLTNGACSSAIGEAGMSKTETEGAPFYLACDPNGKTVVMNPLGFSPQLSAFTFLRETTNAGARAFNVPWGSKEQIRSMARGGGVDDFMKVMFSGTYPHIKLIQEAASGVIAYSGKKIDTDDVAEEPTFLGIHMPGYTRAVLEKLPFLNAIDRINPMGSFGSPARFNNKGDLIDPGQLSVFGATRSGDRKRYDLEDQSFISKVLRGVGFNISVQDTNMNRKYTLADIERTLGDIENRVDFNRLDLYNLQGKTMSPADTARRVEEMKQLIAYRAQLQIERVLLERELNTKGITTRKQDNEIQKEIIKRKGVPLPLQDDIEKITVDAAEKYQRLKRDGYAPL